MSNPSKTNTNTSASASRSKVPTKLVTKEEKRAYINKRANDTLDYLYLELQSSYGSREEIVKHVKDCVKDYPYDHPEGMDENAFRERLFYRVWMMLLDSRKIRILKKTDGEAVEELEEGEIWEENDDNTYVLTRHIVVAA